MSEELSLFGEVIDSSPKESIEKTKKIIKKIKSPKVVKETSNKRITSKKISLEDKVALIRENVYKILGQHKEDTLVIKTKEEFDKYIDKAISNGIIAVDTETNNSLDPITCKLMGLCLYTRGMKQAYIPINHVDFYTREKLGWQLKEEDCREELQRLVDNNVKLVFHNAKFDYEVLKCTCGIELPIYWDTLIGARLLNENERANLKEQYILHINSNQEKYSIEKLFEKEPYEIFDPELFALYSATDSLMTLQLYDYQVEQFKLEDNRRVYNLFRDVEMPCIKVVAEMELRGITLDLEYSKRLSVKYHKLLDIATQKVESEIAKHNEEVARWRLTKEANHHPITYPMENAMKVYKTKEAFDKYFKDVDDKGRQCRVEKSDNEKLSNPIKYTSPTQLAILLYKVLKYPIYDDEDPDGTGVDALTYLSKECHLELAKVLLEFKTLDKLIKAFIDTLPTQVNPKTGRIHCTYNQIGADTGRFSCSDPNLQQIPSKNDEIRMLFKACTKEHYVESNDNVFEIPYTDEVLTINDYVYAKDLKVGDIICGEDGQFTIKEIEYKDEGCKYLIKV